MFSAKIFNLMKYDSYSRFLKSQMYKDCIVYEMEGKSIPFILNIVLNNNSNGTTATTTQNGSNLNISNAQAAICNPNNTNNNPNISNTNTNQASSQQQQQQQQQQQASNTNANGTKETKKRSTILPWTKGNYLTQKQK